MKLICAWCGKEKPATAASGPAIAEVSQVGHETISHGICKEYSAEVMANFKARRVAGAAEPKPGGQEAGEALLWLVRLNQRIEHMLRLVDAGAPDQMMDHAEGTVLQAVRWLREHPLAVRALTVEAYKRNCAEARKDDAANQAAGN